MKKLLRKENLFTLIFIIVTLHPIIELDYLAKDLLGNLPRITTIIDFIVLPLLVVVAFFLFEKNKKKTLAFLGIYIVIFGVYFVVHCKNADIIQYSIHLTSNFFFSITDELVYTITLLLPLAYIYVFCLSDIGEVVMKKICIWMSSLISIPIFVSNIFVFGKSTYVGYTIDNFFSWFSLPYNMYANHPRKYATKFFFEEGNTIGILLVMILPLLYYFLYKEKDNTKKVLLGGLIVVQSLSMIMLSTRVATYSSALIPATMLVVYILLLVLKKEVLKKLYICFLVLLTLVTAVIIPFGPAYQNQQFDAQNYNLVMRDEGRRLDARKFLQEGEKLGKWSEAWRDFYVYMFEDYIYLINVTPPIYYTEWYDYRYDPQFWVDLIFKYDLDQRINGRQIETIFTKYKWDELTPAQKLTGFGFGTFMRGGICIERDFVQQYYSYGPIGVILIMGAWLVLLAYCGIKFLFGYKKGKWTYLNIVLLMSSCLGIACSLTSGHTFDELTTSLFAALCMAFLLKTINKKEEA